MSMSRSLNTSESITADCPKGQRAIETFRAQYNKAGLSSCEAQTLNENPGFASYLLAGIKRFGAQVPDNDLVRNILGADYISPGDIMRNYPEIIYTDAQLLRFAETMPPQETLEWCREHGYILVAGPNNPLSLIEIRDVCQQYFHYKKESWWFEQQQPFSSADKVDTCWLMLRKTPLQWSAAHKWGGREMPLDHDESVPNIAELVWCVTAYHAVRGTYLPQKICVRTSSVTLSGGRVILREFNGRGIILDAISDHFFFMNGDTGLAAIKRV